MWLNPVFLRFIGGRIRIPFFGSVADPGFFFRGLDPQLYYTSNPPTVLYRFKSGSNLISQPQNTRGVSSIIFFGEYFFHFHWNISYIFNLIFLSLFYPLFARLQYLIFYQKGAFTSFIKSFAPSPYQYIRGGGAKPQHYTDCQKSFSPFSIVYLLYEMGQDFLDIGLYCYHRLILYIYYIIDIQSATLCLW